jgi:hypothetical protein
LGSTYSLGGLKLRIFPNDERVDPNQSRSQLMLEINILIRTWLRSMKTAGNIHSHSPASSRGTSLDGTIPSFEDGFGYASGLRKVMDIILNMHIYSMKIISPYAQ